MTEVTRKDNIISRGLQGCHRSEMSVLVHSWATSLQANSLLLNFTDIPVRSEKPFTISFFENSLPGSVHPCTLFPDILPCMSGKDEFYTKLASD